MFTTEIGLYLTYIALACLVGYALKYQRLIDFSPYLAVATGLISNYISPGLANSSIIEIAARIIVAYAILRSAAELTKRLTSPLPVHMRYSTQQPVIEFEEVQ